MVSTSGYQSSNVFGKYNMLIISVSMGLGNEPQRKETRTGKTI